MGLQCGRTGHSCPRGGFSLLARVSPTAMAMGGTCGKTKPRTKLSCRTTLGFRRCLLWASTGPGPGFQPFVQGTDSPKLQPCPLDLSVQQLSIRRDQGPWGCSHPESGRRSSRRQRLPAAWWSVRWVYHMNRETGTLVRTTGSPPGCPAVCPLQALCFS